MFALAMRLSVIIVNYNVKHFLEQCLQSVLKATDGIDSEIWVVDNNSVDGSIDMLKNSFPSVKLIENKDNLGFSKANNQAIKRSSAEYVLLLNPDTIVPEDCFKKTINFMDQHPDAGACGVRMIDGQGKFLPESKRGLPSPEVAFYKMLGLNKLFPKSKKFGKYHLGYLAEHETNEVEVLAGAFMFMRKSVLDKVGLLDETFFMYGEDIDLSYRITQGGFKNYYYPETTIIHYKGESTKKQSVNYVKVFYKAMIIFAEKHYSGSNKKAFTTFINAAIYLRASLSLLITFFKRYWLMILEIVLIFSTLLVLKNYWEEHIKYIKTYPKEMLYIHLPYYTLTFVASLIAIGSYKNIFDFGKLVRAVLVGAAVILIIYGLLPNHLHFSRGIIIFGTLAVTAALFVERSLIHLIKYKTLDFSRSKLTKSILIGTASKWELVTQILKSSGKSYQQIGFVHPEKNDHPQYLGSHEQLKEIVNIYGINEVIFSSESMEASEIMAWMNKIGPSVNYYTIPAKSEFVIGSHSKNSSGLYFGQQIELNLSKPEYKRQKRIFDICMALLLIVLFPIGMLKFGSGMYFSNCLSVLSGAKTWVGYAGETPKNLPILKTGILKTDYAIQGDSSFYKLKLDELYAKNYSVIMDFKTLLGLA